MVSSKDMGHIGLGPEREGGKEGRGGEGREGGEGRGGGEASSVS